jgi:uncharacterized glyoxalase superfamily protein PhnB
MSTVAVLLAYDDVAEAREFFIGALGFEEEWFDADAAGAISRSHLRLDDAEVMIDSPGTHGVQSPKRLGGVTQLLVIGVPDVARHYKRARGAGAHCDGPPKKQSWGGKSYTVTDPEGYMFEFYEAAP